MQIIRGDVPLPEELHGAIIAIGNFDGVHRGHQALLSAARQEADASGSPFGVLTFEPHPRLFFRPEQPMFRLTPLPLKERLIAAMGADFQLTLPFDRGLANLEAREFVQAILVDRLKVSSVVTGYDFHFGHGRKGNPEIMRRLGEEMGFAVRTVEQVTDDGGLAPFSSSSIRDDLRHGRVEEAAWALGYWWIVTGEIVRGDGRGRSLGFPTANILLEPGVEPLEGIYAARIRLPGGFYRGAAYIGSRPTFSSRSRFLEIFIFDFDRDIYGQTGDVQFMGLIRRDLKFSNPAELVAEMHADSAKALSVLRALDVDDPMKKFPLGRLQAAGRL
jgi:riboflavin kinase/FMN adenylyltransferase